MHARVGAACAAAVALAGCHGPPGTTADHDASVIDAQVAVADAGAPADAGPPDAGLPDLIINGERTVIDLAIHERNFAPNACELDPQENCIGASGVRRLLRFSVETPNIGDGDLELGLPSGNNDNFAWSACHMHYHFQGYAEFRLVDGDDNDVAIGHKQAFCLLDSNKYVEGDPSVSDDPKYACFFQGIQRGWSDVYHAALDCQFIDITDTPDGTYTLRVTLNADQSLPELDYANNVFETPVTIGDPDLETSTETCPTGLSDYSTSGNHRECGWVFDKTVGCAPASIVRIGCTTCSGGLGEPCTGDPVIRVCDGARPDGDCPYAAALGVSEQCGGCRMIRNIPCPTSGQLDIYTAPNTLAEPYTCNAGL